MSSPHRRKGGMLHIEKKAVVVRYEGRKYTISWFSGASDEAISRTIDKALGLPLETPAVITDPKNGSKLTISDSIPDGLTLDAKAAVVSKVELGANEKKGAVGALHGRDDDKSRSESPSDGHRSERRLDGDAEDGTTAGAVTVFRGEMLKLERVNAHMANERTWLAWLRNVLSAIGLALGFLSLSEDLDSVYLDGLSSALAAFMVMTTLLAIVTAWLRYTRVKVVLSWTEGQIKATLDRFSLTYFTLCIAVTFTITVPIYILGGINVVNQA